MKITGGVLRRIPRGPLLVVVLYLLMLILPVFLGGRVTTINYLDIFERFANLAPLAIAVGLTMIMAEFDISTVSSAALGGVIAVTVGDSDGILLAVIIGAAAGTLIGTIQGFVIARTKISSVPITLAGFLVVWGIAEIAGGGSTAQVISDNYGAGEWLLKPFATILTVNSVIVLVGVVVLQLILGGSRLGRNIRAVGGDRNASTISGIRVPLVVIGVFALAGLIAALGGSLQALSYSTQNPVVSFEPLLLAVISAIMGGVGISGAVGSPAGIACGALALCILQETFLVLGVDQNLSMVLTGTVLLVIAAASAPELRIPARWRMKLASFSPRNRSKAVDLDPSRS